MTHIVMLLSNGFRPDPRVLKEANSLAERGYRVTVIAWDRASESAPCETLETGVQILRIQNVPSSYGIGARQLFRMPRFWRACLPELKGLQPDLIHCHDFDTLPAGLWWGKTHKVPVIYDAHEYYADLCKPRLKGRMGSILYHLIRVAEHLGARMASGIVTVDETLAKIYQRYNRKIVIIGHYPPRKLADQVPLAFTRPQLILLYLGRLSKDRGLFTYADILRYLDKHNIPVSLRLAGVFTPASEEPAFFDYAKETAHLIDNLGWVAYDEVPGLLQSADLGLAILKPEPRYVAALPVKLFEYMAAGLPVVASNFPPIQRIIDETRCGITVNPVDDPERIAEKIREWWENPKTAQEAGQNGQLAIRNKYNWENLVDELDNIYASLMETA